MSRSPAQDNNHSNLLLASLSEENRHRLLESSEVIELTFGETVYHPQKMIESVYFLLSGIVSLLSRSDSLATLEIGLVGNEGFAGLPVFLGVTKSANEAIVQGQGSAIKIETSVFLKECQRNSELNVLLKRYAHYRLTQVSVTATCNRFHKVDARLARWLLMTSDRMGSNEFQITQEFLSHMLGVRREAVTHAAGMLQENGIIEYSRGNMRVIDPAALADLSCECYRLICEEQKSVFE